MISFENDYSEGAHEAVLNQLVATNLMQEPGYGIDSFTQQAIAKIKETIACPKAGIRFLVGGTQTNQVVIHSMLAPFEGVLSADTGHINAHEAGAIEHSGHKVIPLPSKEGKISANTVENYLLDFYADPTYAHQVIPGMVYISYPTEYGTLYTAEELKNLAEVCQKNQLPLYIDGARLGYGLASPAADLTMAELAALCDVFYIGGTKVGALCGEAVVFTKNNEPKHFMTRVKQHGALVAKGRLLGVQFLTLFTDDLYLEISKHAIVMAEKLKQGFLAKGYRLFLDSPTNQQFFVLHNQKIQELEKEVRFSVWEKFDDQHTVVRFATSWATTAENVSYVLSLL